MTQQEARLLSPQNLAYIGDVVYELMTREHILARGNAPVNRLHKAVVPLVCAGGQSQGLEAIAGLLTEEEESIYRRGRNVNGSHPKNADPQEYRRATGVEALFGYLYLTGRTDRVQELYEKKYQALTGEPPAEAASSVEPAESPGKE